MIKSYFSFNISAFYFIGVINLWFDCKNSIKKLEIKSINKIVSRRNTVENYKNYNES